MNLIFSLILISILPQHRAFWKLVEDPKTKEVLSLSKEQVKEMEDVLYETSEKLLSLKSERKIKELKLRRLLKEDSPDPKAIEKLVKEIGELKTKERLGIVKEDLRIREVLSKEQWRKFLKTRKKFRKPPKMKLSGRRAPMRIRR